MRTMSIMFKTMHVQIGEVIFYLLLVIPFRICSGGENIPKSLVICMFSSSFLWWYDNRKMGYPFSITLVQTHRCTNVQNYHLSDIQVTTV